jgi:CheY-like chemotaxis protein
VKYKSELVVVLMDIELKGSKMNGLELTRLARGQLAPSQLPPYALAVTPISSPILFVTAYGQQYRRAELLNAGADEVVEKPVDFDALHATMARIYLQRLKRVAL